MRLWVSLRLSHEALTAMARGTYAARAESSSRRAVLTLARAFMASPMEVLRVADQGVTNRSAMIESWSKRASPTWSWEDEHMQRDEM